MFNSPKIPKEELEYKKNYFFLRLYEQYQVSARWLYWTLLVALILYFPLVYLLQIPMASYMIKSYHPPVVNQNPYNPESIKVLKTDILSLGADSYSVYAQILNPNPGISARHFQYEFDLKDGEGQTLEKISGQDYIVAGLSKYIFVPQINLAGVPKTADLTLSDFKWTRATGDPTFKLEVLQKNSGISPEGKYFVEAVLHNPNSVGLKSVYVQSMLFDKSSQQIFAINSTVISDLLPGEGRYFKLVWPRPFNNISYAEIAPQVNLLDPGFLLPKSDDLPLR